MKEPVRSHGREREEEKGKGKGKGRKREVKFSHIFNPIVATDPTFKNLSLSLINILFADTYAKLTLMSPNGQEITHSKTSVRRGQPNPLYKETFMFQVPESQLPEVTLMVSVFYNRNIKRKEMIGWFSLGNSQRHRFAVQNI